MALSNWFWLVWFSFLLSSTDSSDVQLISVGSDFNCHYQPEQLYDAMQKHEKLYLSNDFVIQSLKVKNAQTHLVGGYDDCTDINNGILSEQRSIISGNQESVAVAINAQSNQSVTLENFEIRGGHSKEAGGIAVINAQSLTVINSWIYQNISLGSGGGIHLMGDVIEFNLLNSKIFHNHSMIDGGGIAVSGNSNLINLIDSEVFANKAVHAGGGINCFNNNHITLSSTKKTVNAVISKNKASIGDNLYYALTCQFFMGKDVLKI